LKVGYTNVLDLTGVQERLHFLPTSFSQPSIILGIMLATHHVFT
jgi:hypothetical protein